VNLLDHGYLTYIEHWGSDERIVESARMSTDGAFRGWGDPSDRCEACQGLGFVYASPIHDETCSVCRGKKYKPGDEKLLRYLWENKHASPFEMAGMTIEVQAPIFVFREWHRHRTQSYNELSARYTALPDRNYQPTVQRLFLVDGKNKQAQAVDGAKALTMDAALAWLSKLDKYYRDGEELYQHGLAIGIPKELARLPLPVARYSRMRASGNLRNWLGFLSLRMDKSAQWEIRQYANAMHAILKDKFPRTMDLFDGR
jgi:thymidylate synthase (FAD)